MKQKAIIELCKELGCCDACCVRYLGLKTPSAYENAQQFIIKLICEETSQPDTLNKQIEVEPVEPTDNPPEEAKTELSENDATDKPNKVQDTCKSQPTARSGDREDTLCSEPRTKRMKVEGVCVTCLGVLQEENWPQCWNMVKEMLDKKRYECATFACALSSPIAAILRERVVSLRLKDALPDYDDGSLTPLKEAWKWSFGVQLARHAGKVLDSGAVSPLLVTLNMEYPEEAQELEVLKALAPALFSARRAAGRRFGVEFTRRSVEQALAGASLAALVAAGLPAPAAPRTRVACVSVVCTHAPLYLGGRYVKLSRALPQTPWLVGGVRMMHSSVQELICQPVAALFGLGVEDAEHRLKFMSAGREDVDVRCLGDGRPFAIEITDPTREPSEVELSELCEQISTSGHVRVRRLVRVSREDLAELKKGEETKCKTYELLCIKLSRSDDDEPAANGGGDASHSGAVGVPVTERDIARINSYRNTPADDPARVLLQQRTPIRVLHRRPLLTRTRRILALTARAVPGQPTLLALRVRTDAGTYVKEWAHGELGRTRPRLADALGARADILALDVAAVELDWPRAHSHTITT